MAEILLQDITSWHWMILAIILISFEILVPGVFFLWVGLAAIVVSILSYFLPISVTYQLVVFAILTPIASWLGKRFMRSCQSGLPASKLNKRAIRMLGKEFILTQDILNGKGRENAGGTLWKIQGADLAKGTRVKVTALDGNCLVVEAVDSSV